MSSPITISLLRAPRGKGRARAFLRGGRISHYTPAATVSYEGMARAAQEVSKRAMEASPTRFPGSPVPDTGQPAERISDEAAT